MVRPTDRDRAEALKQLLLDYSKNLRALPGIQPAGHLDCLVAQIVDSLRRIEFAHFIRDSKRSGSSRANPSSPLFDPLRAAVLRYREGNVDEAYWLIFVATHFGKHAQDGWHLARDVYGALGAGFLWDWNRISTRTADFRPWLAANEERLRKNRFSNHRRYESIRAGSAKGTASVFETYVTWVGPSRSHADIIREAHKKVGQHPHETFNFLYESMSSVQRFGRLGKFDFFTMLGKLGVAPIDPGSAYLASATGPLRGARLLFKGSTDAALKGNAADELFGELDSHLKVGMQVLEDSLCNWQKSPEAFVSFRG